MNESSAGVRHQTSRAPWPVRIAAVLLIAVQAPVLVDEAWDPNQSDFGNYLTPAVALAQGGDLGDLYEGDRFAGWMEKAGLIGLGSFVPHPPTNALWLRSFASLSPSTVKAWWTAILLLSLGLTVAAVARIAPVSLTMATVIVLGPTLAVRNGLSFGQPYLVLGAFLSCAVWALERGKDFWAGVLLGLGASFKPYALPIAFLFVHRARLRSLAGFACGVMAPVALVLLMASGHPFTAYFERVVPWMFRGEIQDPFAAGWGSLSALLNRLLRFEPDLNPHPWVQAPLLARALSAAAVATLLVVGILCGRLALQREKALDAVGIVIAFAVAASPFGASYQLVLLVTSVVAVAARLHGSGLGLWLIAWALLGSPLLNILRSATGMMTPLAYLRWFCLLGLAIAVARPFLRARFVRPAVAAGVLAAALSLPWGGNQEAWARVEAARGYSMHRPHFCGEQLRWWSPAEDGRSLVALGAGRDCRTPAGPSPVTARFADGSWNLYLRTGGLESRLTFSDANEVDPVLTPDGCAVVFASDQGRGLGSTALYQLDLSGFISGCAAGRRVETRR